jgi:hypothetical protein
MQTKCSRGLSTRVLLPPIIIDTSTEYSVTERQTGPNSLIPDVEKKRGQERNHTMKDKRDSLHERFCLV